MTLRAVAPQGLTNVPITINNNLTVTGTITENTYPVVSQNDIGTAPNEISVNGMLGSMAFQSEEAVVVKPQATAIPVGVGDMVFQLTNDTTLVVKVKGSDGTVRSNTLTLA